jgi:hypothetical protein
MISDPRYDAVGSSSLRAELFQRHVKNLSVQADTSQTETPEQAAAKKARERKEKAQASLRERQQAVQGEKMRLERDLQRSKYGAGKEDGEREFGSLLLQAVREHNVGGHTDDYGSKLFLLIRVSLSRHLGTKQYRNWKRTSGGITRLLLWQTNTTCSSRTSKR